MAQLSFYETGEILQKNLDVMKEAVVQVDEVASEINEEARGTGEEMLEEGKEIASCDCLQVLGKQQ